MIIKNDAQLQEYIRVTKTSVGILKKLVEAVQIGVTPLKIDSLADKLCQNSSVKPNFKGQGSPKNLYKHATCISVNDEVVHGIPSNTPLNKGDLVKIDFGTFDRGLNTDQCVTVAVGDFLNKEDERLMIVGKKAVQSAVNLAIEGNKTGDLGHTMQDVAERSGFNVIKEFIGHGIGQKLHEEPELPAYGRKNSGQTLREGMVICVEAQIVAGSDEIFVDESGWTVKTVDGKNAVMFEYMVVVGKNKPIILTETMGWEMVAG